MQKLRQFNFTITSSLVVMIMAVNLDCAIDSFKIAFGERLFSEVKYVEIC